MDEIYLIASADVSIDSRDSVAFTPEPRTDVLLACGLALLGARRRRR